MKLKFYKLILKLLDNDRFKYTFCSIVALVLLPFWLLMITIIIIACPFIALINPGWFERKIDKKAEDVNNIQQGPL